MAYHFDPVRTRMAVAAITSRFPLERDRVPPARLRALFETIAGMPYEDMGRWGKRLPQESVETLYHGANRAPDSKILSGIAAALGFRSDRRCAEIVHQFLHRLPPHVERGFLCRLWRERNMGARLDTGSRWYRAYLEGTGDTAIVDFALEGLAEGRFSMRRLIGEVAPETPLLQALTAAIFRRGGALIEKIEPQMAAVRVKEALEAGGDAEVYTYLNHYPVRFWRPDFVEALYRQKGAPDPETSSFYGAVEIGRIWDLRKLLFGKRLADTGWSGARQIFWSRWMHRCQDWRIDGEKVVLTVRPLKVVELPERSIVFLLEGGKHPLETLPFDSGWMESMERLLADRLEWGYRA